MNVTSTNLRCCTHRNTRDTATTRASATSCSLLTTTERGADVAGAATRSNRGAPFQGNPMKNAVSPAEDVDPSVKEALAVHAWRAEQLRRLGVPAIIADTFADVVDWHALSALMERGCPVELAFEITR